MRRNRTEQRPIFDLKRPVTNRWSWEVTLRVASSGYATRVLVAARTTPADGDLYGSAAAEVEPFDDITKVIEHLAVESMLQACEPTLLGHGHREIPHRDLML